MKEQVNRRESSSMKANSMSTTATEIDRISKAIRSELSRHLEALSPRELWHLTVYGTVGICARRGGKVEVVTTGGSAGRAEINDDLAFGRDDRYFLGYLDVGGVFFAKNHQEELESIFVGTGVVVPPPSDVDADSDIRDDAWLTTTGEWFAATPTAIAAARRFLLAQSDKSDQFEYLAERCGASERVD